MSKPKRGHLLRNVVIVAAVVLFSVGAVVATPPILFFNVTVGGTATARAGATPANVTFVDENGIPYVAPVGASGGYSISLQNGHTYLVYVGYSTAGNAAGANCSAGTLILNTLGWSQVLDAAC